MGHLIPDAYRRHLPGLVGIPSSAFATGLQETPAPPSRGAGLAFGGTGVVNGVAEAIAGDFIPIRMTDIRPLVPVSAERSKVEARQGSLPDGLDVDIWLPDNGNSALEKLAASRDLHIRKHPVRQTDG